MYAPGARFIIFGSLRDCFELALFCKQRLLLSAVSSQFCRVQTVVISSVSVARIGFSGFGSHGCGPAGDLLSSLSSQRSSSTSTDRDSGSTGGGRVAFAKAACSERIKSRLSLAIPFAVHVAHVARPAFLRCLSAGSSCGRIDHLSRSIVGH